MTQSERERSKTLRVAAEILKQLDHELKILSDSTYNAYRENVAWTQFAKRAEPVLRELAQVIPGPRMVKGSIRPEVVLE